LLTSENIFSECKGNYILPEDFVPETPIYDEIPSENNQDNDSEQNTEILVAFLNNPQATVEELVTLKLTGVDYSLQEDLLVLAEQLLSPLTYDELIQLNIKNIASQLVPTFAKILTHKFKAKKEQAKEQEKPQPITNTVKTLQTISKYFQKNRINTLTIKSDGKILITYLDKSSSSSSSSSSSELQLIKTYCQQKGLTSLTRQDLAIKTVNKQTITNNNDVDIPIIIGTSLISM
jgi:hypothetical protein